MAYRDYIHIYFMESDKASKDIASAFIHIEISINLTVFSLDKYNLKLL